MALAQQDVNIILSTLNEGIEVLAVPDFTENSYVGSTGTSTAPSRSHWRNVMSFI